MKITTKPNDNALIDQYLTTHDPGLREQIIVRYVPLVHFVLGRLGLSRADAQDYEDLVSQGLLGLIDAIDRYDPAHGTQFSTYATLRVRGMVLDYLRSQDWLPRAARQRARAVQHAITKLWVELGRLPTNDEIATHLKIELEKVEQALLDSNRVIVSLDTVVGMDGEDGASLYEVLADEEQTDPSEVISEMDQQARLVDALKLLPQREQQILSLYYYEELTFKEIGAVLDVSESRVSQLHARAVMSLHAMLAKLEQQHLHSGSNLSLLDSAHTATVLLAGIIGLLGSAQFWNVFTGGSGL